MKSTKSGLNDNGWPKRTFSPVRASTGHWVLKIGGPLSYLEGFCVTQKNWQDFGEWRQERRKKLERQNSSDLVSSSLKSTTNMTTTVRQIWTSFGEIDKRCFETKYLLYFFYCVVFCVV